MAVSQINGASIESGAIPPADLSTGAPAWDGSGNLSFNSGYGSDAVAYGCRAWVNFNGTGTVAIRASGNVSSITDGGTGTYTINFTTAMPDTSYCISSGSNAAQLRLGTAAQHTTSSCLFVTEADDGTNEDNAVVCLSIFR
jgi:hypothetical protein